MTDSAPALQHTAEPKRSVGIFTINPFDEKITLTDTGMRVYVDPITGDLDTYAPDEATHEQLDNYLAVALQPEMTADQFLHYAKTSANGDNVLGSSRVFYDPRTAREAGILNPATMSITEACAHQGM